jgi:two-component system CheB/CheR fusion protein
MMRILPYRTVENMIKGVVITFMDVTRITEAEARVSELSKALRNRVESLETLLDLIPVGVFIMEDSASEQIRINPHGARLLGEEDPGRAPRGGVRLRLFKGESEIPLRDQPLQQAARTGQPVNHVEAVLRLENGRERNVLISATPLFDEQGKVRGAIAAMVDITQHK